MKTFDEAVQWAKGRHVEAVKIADAFVPKNVNKRKPGYRPEPAAPSPVTPSKNPNGKAK
jgi:hypothetical protein